ncbi:hypothetical protein FBU30_004113 [Linnemannia zychae]|nr:hypothetical protein FBU30_004113 [Linnemannia zychae]
MLNNPDNATEDLPSDSSGNPTPGTAEHTVTPSDGGEQNETHTYAAAVVEPESISKFENIKADPIVTYSIEVEPVVIESESAVASELEDIKSVVQSTTTYLKTEHDNQYHSAKSFKVNVTVMMGDFLCKLTYVLVENDNVTFDGPFHGMWGPNDQVTLLSIIETKYGLVNIDAAIKMLTLGAPEN